jgi:hypothetical protein
MTRKRPDITAKFAKTRAEFGSEIERVRKLGLTYPEIADYLNRDDATPLGREWTAGNVFQCLRNYRLQRGF